MSLETGTMDAFAPARRLYRTAELEPCEPLGNHSFDPGSVCMPLALM